MQLVANGLGGDLREILEHLGVRGASGLTDDVLLEKFRANKTGYAAELADRIRSNRRIAKRGPEAIRAAIGTLPTLNANNLVRNGDSGTRTPDSRMRSA